MQRYIQSVNDIPKAAARISIFSTEEDLKAYKLSPEGFSFAQDYFKRNESDSLLFQQMPYMHFFVKVDDAAEKFKRLEKMRIAGDKTAAGLNAQFVSQVVIEGDQMAAIAFAEGMALGNYQFNYYKSEAKANSLKDIFILNGDQSELDKKNIALSAVFQIRDLVNEPLNKLNANQLAERLAKYAESSGAGSEILGRKKIEALKMGGLLAVNSGSIDPPTFTILEWKPEGHINEKPVALVGKGVVYDTGGMNLKTGSYMDDMKCDMGGGALMGTAVAAAAELKLPLWIIAFIPATDNRCNGNAYVPGDIIKMYNGKTVEVLNTDAEGRLILADAISYAEKYDPMLVITAATLTGSAMRAVGKQALVAMGSNSAEYMAQLKKSGDEVYERVAELPFYDEYAEELKSSIADMTNLGSAEGGAITAGKFLEKFTSKAFIHLDIAGVAFTTKKYQYRGQGGTGFGLRLLIDFLDSLAQNTREQ